MGVVNCDAQGVRVGWVHAVSPAGTTLNYKLVVAANAVCGIHFLKMFFSGPGRPFYLSIQAGWLSGVSSLSGCH